MDAPIVLQSVSVPKGWDIDTQQPSESGFSNTQNGNNKGFPFDDSDFDSRDRSSFNSHLEDLAKRHPELAEHLNFDKKFTQFPFHSNTWGHNRRGSSFGDDDTEPRSFKTSSRFGSPFSSTFEKDFPFHKESSFKEEGEPVQEQELKQTEKPPTVPTASERSRKFNPNVPPSNTVDLGQKQESLKDLRPQRSMSAPPENRAGQQRFVSSINIPVQGENDTNTAQSQTQQPKQQSTNERVIPIHVEGRDEPVIPKKANNTFTQPQAQPDRAFSPRSGFGGNSWNRGDSPYYTGEPQFHQEEPHHFYNNAHRNEGFNNMGPGTFKQQKPSQTTPHTEQSQNPTPPQQPQNHTPPPPPPNIKLGPMDQIQRIQQDVCDLMNKVEKFNGKPKDKDCIYLDEMLTRNLLKLDDVETEGKENIRNARKETIKCIQRCISILEAKATANESLHNQLMDISKGPQLTSLEVSGVTRSGAEASVQEEVPTALGNTSTTIETPNQEQTTSKQNTEAEVLADNPSTAQEKPEAVTLQNEQVAMDAEVVSEENKTSSNSTTESTEGVKEQPMEVDEVEEKKDKKKVKKKVDKDEKH